MLQETFIICPKEIGHRGIENTLDKFQRMSFVLSAWDKIRKFAKYFDVCQALAEVIEVYKQGKSKLVSIDILKEFRSDNNTHVFLSDPPPTPQHWKEMKLKKFLI